jgi:hypothetical protein
MRTLVYQYREIVLYTIHPGPTHLIPLSTVLNNLVGDSAGLGKRRYILADRVEADLELLGQGSAQLCFGLVTNDGDGSLLFGVLLLELTGDGRVDTTAKTTVGRDTDVEDLGGLALGLGVLEELCGWSASSLR